MNTGRFRKLSSLAAMATLLLCFSASYAQKPAKTFLERYNLSTTVINPDTAPTDGIYSWWTESQKKDWSSYGNKPFADEWLYRPEPLGFRGDNFQRFYIHFDKVVIEFKQLPEDAVLDGVEPGVPCGFLHGGLLEGAAYAVLRDDAPEAEGLGTYRVAPEGVDGLVAHQPGEDGDEEGAHDVGGIGRVGTGVAQGRAAEEAVEEARFAEVFGEVGDAAEVGHPPLAVPAGTEGGYAAAEGGRVWVLTSGGESAKVEGDGGFHGSPLVL